MFFRKSKAPGNDNAQAPIAEPGIAVSPQITVIGPDTVLNGNIDCDGEIRIEGRVRGYVHAASLTVSPKGIIEGEVIADDLAVQGYIKGPLRAGHVHLLSGALVEGNLTCVTIAIDNGAHLSGTVRQEHPAGAAADILVYDGNVGQGAPTVWESMQDDAFRPLAAVRPRGGSR